MFPRVPATGCEPLPAGLCCPLFEGAGHAVIPSIQQPEEADHPEQFDDLAVIPVLAQTVLQICIDCIRDRRCGECEVERNPLRFGEGGMCAILPDVLQLLRFGAVALRGPDSVRLTVAATRRVTGDKTDELHKRFVKLVSPGDL